MNSFLKVVFKQIFRRKATVLASAICFTVIVINIDMLRNITINRTKHSIDHRIPITVFEYRPPQAVYGNTKNIKLKETYNKTNAEKEYKFPLEFNLEFASPPTPQPKIKLVIIVAGYRTGSTFVGEFFNQHPDVFYIFEPLYYTARYLPLYL